MRYPLDHIKIRPLQFGDYKPLTKYIWDGPQDRD
jgi:hypothetical protein